MQQSTMSVPGSLPGSDRGGARMLPGGNGIGMMSGINRSITMSRPGFPGIPSPSMLSSGGMLSSSMVGMPSPVNIHSGVGGGQGNSMLRPRETVHMMRVRTVHILSWNIIGVLLITFNVLKLEFLLVAMKHPTSILVLMFLLASLGNFYQISSILIDFPLDICVTFVFVILFIPTNDFSSHFL